MPKFVEKEEYFRVLSRITGSLKSQNGVISIYQMGNTNHPGISDLDIIAVFKDDTLVDYKPWIHLKGIDRYLITHGLTGVSITHFIGNCRYSLWHNLHHLWGEKIGFEEKSLEESEIDAIKVQTALEFLVENYVSLTVQREYGVIKLRSLLQHIKAMDYDLEFLRIDSGRVHSMVSQLREWLHHWFEIPVKLKAFCDWIDEFYEEFQRFFEMCLKRYVLYIPDWAHLHLSRNIKLEYGDPVGYQFSGISMPKFVSGINRKTFNLNSRFNSFVFRIPYSRRAEDKILDERYNYYRRQKLHTARYYHHFMPLIPGFAYKIL